MVACASCGTGNPDGHRFCGDCGAELVTICPACGTPSPPTQRFCGACGAALGARELPPAPVAATERRVCSVLFADLVGFTPLSEARDPEEVRELLSRYFGVARTVIARYGGVVEKFIGDAVMAVWGTPVAGEADAERAVRAGLDLVAAVTALGDETGVSGLALRAGVVTGEVAATIGAVGEGMVAGDAVNTAARVQAAATPGSVWVDGSTQRRAGAGIGFADAGTHTLKGKAEPQQLWRATRVLSSVGGAQRVDGLEAPMVGRDAEDRTLRDLFHSTTDRGTPRLVTVCGPAGIGKSRLGWEFEKYVDGLAEVMWWHRGRCLTYADGVPYWALAEAVRQRFEIGEDETTADATAKFLTGLDRFVADPDERSHVGVRLGRLLGLTHPDDPGSALSRDDLFGGWRMFLERLAEVAPVLLLVEDAHHADDELLDFVVHLVEWARQSPVYVVLFARLELARRRPDLLAGRNRTSLTLDPLSDRALAELLTSLVHEVPEQAVAAMVRQADGNPLFAVEIVRSLIDQDVVKRVDGRYEMVGDPGALTVPDGLHGLLAARLDALDPPQRALIADASVLGTTFPAEALVPISGRPAAEVVAHLGELVRREILDVTADPLSPQRGSYRFSQDLLRQVAYNTLSRRDRRARHLAVAEHLQRAFSAGGEEVMDVVAQHYLDALNAIPGEDDDDIRQRAVDSLLRAGERAERAAALASAGRSFRRAADLSAGDAGTAGGLLERAALSFGSVGDHDVALEIAAQARTAYLSVGERRAAARLLAWSGRWLSAERRNAEARAHCEEALLELREPPDLDTIEALGNLAAIMTFSGDVAARGTADEALRLAQDLAVGPGVLGRVYAISGVADQFDQRVDEAALKLRHAAALCERAGMTDALGRVLNNLASTEMIEDAAAAMATARRAVEACRRSGQRFLLGVSTGTFIECALLTGEWATALAEVAALDFDPLEEPDLAITTAVLRALTGDLDAALALAEAPRARELTATDDLQDVAYMSWLNASLAFAAGDTGRALGLLSTVVDLVGVDFGEAAFIWGWPLAARCAYTLGDLDELRRFVAVVAERPPGRLGVVLRSSLALARAWLAPDDEDAWDAAIVALRAAGSPYHLAHGLLDRAALLASDDADSLRAEAAAIGERLGAVDVLARLETVPPHA
ncbi:adenylate/guanylate cyclase domain-containing protein [Jatrophihabitans endophyticus]|uniref:adenylate/guanylate cyclase domain-containing protein n=1 Tax=Jatrophihabitans endophyticus TaxID=1206085 RepID=UPI0019E191E3|nr:adenylate/guanylate cyclase domain-containing protein [Jatrophihabitans endophyticus]MBE7186988.1 AAA family ATPase [Jatrophihabitans endophyticus]